MLYYIIKVLHHTKIKFNIFHYTDNDLLTTKYGIYLIRKFIDIYENKNMLDLSLLKKNVFIFNKDY